MTCRVCRQNPDLPPLTPCDVCRAPHCGECLYTCELCGRGVGPKCCLTQDGCRGCRP